MCGACLVEWILKTCLAFALLVLLPDGNFTQTDIKYVDYVNHSICDSVKQFYFVTSFLNVMILILSVGYSDRSDNPQFCFNFFQDGLGVV